MDFISRLVIFLKARYPLLYIMTDEEARLEALIRNYCGKQHLSRVLYVWNFNEGYYEPLNGKGFSSNDPLKALEFIVTFPSATPTIFILKDFHIYLHDPVIQRKLKDLNFLLQNQQKNIIIVASEVDIPSSLNEIITLLYFPLPTYTEILDEIIRLECSLQQKISSELIANLALACQGLSFERIRKVISKIVIQGGQLNAQSPAIIFEEKRQIIQQTQLLDFITIDKTIADIGGLDNFKNWLELREDAFLPAAKEFGLPYPKGILLTGVPGTGKSMAAQIVATEWNLPLLKLDFGRVFSSLVGESESKMRKIIQILESVSPCVVWVDEFDKTFSTTLGNGDSGTTKRVLGTFITWLAEKTKPIFIVATANDVTSIPTELLRKGRFDELFFFSLPTIEERQEIFAIKSMKYLKSEQFTTKTLLYSDALSRISEGFSGAEIEQVILNAMRVAYTEMRDCTFEDVAYELEDFVPLSKLKHDEFKHLTEWAQLAGIKNVSRYAEF